MLKKIFTWWDGATIGTLLFSKLNGTRMGEDALAMSIMKAARPPTAAPAAG